VQAYNARTQQWSVEEPLTSPRHKACAVGIDDFIVVTGGTMLGLGKLKPSWLAEIGTRDRFYKTLFKPKNFSVKFTYLGQGDKMSLIKNRPKCSPTHFCQN
jgi:hypothetical protein